ncbi:LytTR family transcriptional regulator DNA-binding domain-containing protein [Larkinella soli]|uniref:LytTR family transcriptional regulator DNA-binding domain-containing protein n=1 Tax=Larkinella soli TaxID=1770527 RepID=UPI000FFBA53F|nr:LytTR family transcriptional regulator DNA-binding domain-containing protein [Larkinella soli]
MFNLNELRSQTLIPSPEIAYLYTEGFSTLVICCDAQGVQCVSTTAPLEYWESFLPTFWRINDTYLVNPEHVQSFQPADFPDFPLPVMELSTGRQLAVSRRHMNTILKKWAGLNRRSGVTG